MKILRTASLGTNFTGSYKKECSLCFQVVQRKQVDCKVTTKNVINYK